MTRPRISFTSVLKCFLYIINQTFAFVVLAVNVHVFTLRWTEDTAWCNTVVLLIITLVILYRVVELYHRKLFIVVLSVIAITAQATASVTLLARIKDNGVTPTSIPIPGPWFTGCFPYLQHKESRLIWLSALAVQSLVLIAAVISTLLSRCANPSASFFSLARRDGIFYFMAIAASTVFSVTYFSVAPRSIKLIAPSIPITSCSVFGSLLLLNLFNQQHAAQEMELSGILSHAETEGGVDQVKVSDVEMGLVAPHRINKIQMTPDSEAGTLFLSPCVTVTSRQDMSRRDAEKHSPIEKSSTTMVYSRYTSSEGLSMDQTFINEERLQRPTLANLNTKASNSSLNRRHFSEDSPRIRKKEMALQQREDEWAALDKALEKEYDEQGQRRRPIRTHTRQWKSDELAIVAPPFMPSTVAPGLRLTDLNFGAPRRKATTSPKSSWPISSNAVASSSSLPIPPMAVKKVPTRSRLSILLHLRKQSSESNAPSSSSTLPPAPSSPSPVPVAESQSEEMIDAFPGSFATISNTSPASPESPSHRSLSVRKSSRSNTARIRRLLAASGGPLGSPGSTRTRPRGESDAATICSASTSWAFDNTNVHDAPDFCS
ncbi:hypothetical protein FRB97_007790 [Tulasnella sp. 331]|nr:hypothetical protein FRB97_007790 [Tulasnella sp. 331]